MPDVELARRDGVELVNTGSWQLLSGNWSPNSKDIADAVEASKCPAVRRPRLKLGHSDARFNTDDDKTLDGTPALGWFDNLRASADGNTLVGDQVALPWLSAVQPAAWPDRSIEGKYQSRCALGHTHPFVVTAVSLLGETPPGIPTLKSIKSLDDLPAALGVAAAGEAPEGGRDVEATVRAAADVQTGAMVALIPTAEDAARLAVEGGEPAEELHVTLAYLGEVADLGARGRQDVIDAVSSAVNGLPMLEAEAFAVSAFNPASTERDPCLVYGLSGDMLDAVHDLVDTALFGADSWIDAPIPSQHRPWVAHLTGIYTADLTRIADLVSRLGPVTFDRIRMAFGGDHVDIPLIEWPAEDPVGEEPELVAAAAGNAEQLRSYWTKGPGLAKWQGKPHPFTALYRHLRKFLSEDRAKRTAASWYHAVLGHWPGAGKGVKASDGTTVTVDWNPGAGGDALVDAIKAAIADRYPTPVLPAAEPEQPQHEEDPVSLSDDMRSRLGLADGAEEVDALAAIDALKAAAEKTPEPDQQLIQASAAAAEKASKAEAALEVMKEELARQSTELATIKASAAQTVKASFFDGLLATGKLKPADRETWEARYDRDAEMVTDILGTRAEGSEVPVMASGVTGPAEPTGTDPLDAEYVRMFGADEKASA